MSKVTKYKTTIDKIGSVEDYTNLPIIENDEVVGMVLKAKETKKGFVLSLFRWKEKVVVPETNPFTHIEIKKL